jgi:ribosome-associated heat shock protein Hsp15
LALAEPSLRIDKILWFLRVTKTRSAARAMAEAGHVRIDGRRIDRAHCPVGVGAVLTFMHHDRVRVARVVALPARRCSPAEVAAYLIDVTGVDDTPLES